MKNKVSRYFKTEEKLMVSIELTNHCNFQCPICPVSYRKNKQNQPLGMPYDRPLGFMELHVFERAVEECERVAKTLNFGFFGEQVLHPNYKFFMNKIKKRNFMVDINTNMSIVNAEIMSNWIENELDLVRISIDAINSQIFNHSRPGVVFNMDGNKVEESERLKAITEKIKYWLNLKNHRPTQLVYVKSSYNEYQNEKEDFVKYWKPFLGKKDRILCKNIISYGGKIYDPNIASSECNIWKLKYLMIDWRGMVTPCNLDINLDLCLGSILKNSLENLYLSDKASAIKLLTGCGNDIYPCKACVDSNNWNSNEVFQ